MNNDMQSLAMRAVASPHWRWMPGMLCIHDAWNGAAARVAHVDDDYTPSALDLAWAWPETDGGVHPRGVLPVLSDAATLGCLLALVQEAHGATVWLAAATMPDPLDDSSHVPITEPPSWLVFVAHDGDYVDVIGQGRTQSAALVAALEATR